MLQVEMEVILTQKKKVEMQHLSFENYERFHFNYGLLQGILR